MGKKKVVPVEYSGAKKLMAPFEKNVEKKEQTLSAPQKVLKEEKAKNETQSDLDKYQKTFDDISSKLGNMRNVNSKSGGRKVFSDKDISVYTARLKNVGKILAGLYEKRGELDKMYEVRSRVSNALLAQEEDAAPRGIQGISMPNSIRREVNRSLDEAHYRADADNIAKKYIDKEYSEDGNDVKDFMNRFGANYTAAKLGTKSSKGGYDYAQKPTSAREYYNDTVEKIKQQFAGRNSGIVGKGGLIDKNLASYLPQLEGQIDYGVQGVVVVGGTAALTGNPKLALGAAKYGYALGSGKYSYEQMYGDSFNKFSKITDFDTAKKMAHDEGLLSGGVEGIDTLTDIASLGFGKLLKVLGKESVEKMAKDSIYKVLGKYAANVLGEGGQEGLQELISIANERRLEKGTTDSGVSGLVEETITLIGEIAKGENEEAFKRAKESGIEGMKTAAVIGAPAAAINTMATNAIIDEKSGSKKAENTDDVLYQIEDEDGKILNTDGSSGKIDVGKSSQTNVMWTLGDEVLDRREVAIFYSKISEMRNQNYKNYHSTAEGEYIFEIENKLVVTDGRYKNPKISTVFTFESKNETVNAIARGYFYEQTQSGRSIRDAQSIVEIIYGEGFINRADIGDSRAYAQMRNRGRKGTSGTEIDSRSGKNVDDFDRVIAMGDNDAAEIARKNTADVKTDGPDVLYQIERDDNGHEYWHIESDKDIFKDLKTTNELKSAAYNYLLHGDKGTEIEGLIDGENLDFRRVSAREYVYGTDSMELSSDEYGQKMRMSPSIVDLIKNAPIKYDAPDHKSHKMFPDGFKNYQGRVGIDDTVFRYIVRVGKAKDGKVFYDINLEVDGKVPRAKSTSLIKTSTSNTNNISQNAKNINKNITDFDRVIAMGDNDAAEIARKNTADVKTDGPDVLYQIEDEDGKILNTDDKSGKIKGDGSQFRVMWTIEDGTLTEQDVALVYREIEKINNRGIDNCDMSADGEYILDINNKLIYTDADHKFPEISKVISFDSEYEDDIYLAKEMLLNEERAQSSVDIALQTIEIMYGQGFVGARNFEDSRAYARLQDRRRKGTSGTEIDSRSGKNVDDFDRVIAMGDNDAAEIARKNTADVKSDGPDVLYQIEDEDGKILNTDDKSGKIEIERKSAIETKIKYSPNGLKLPAEERERLFSRISTDYYHTNKTHEGLQYQSVVTDSEHLLYVYQDGGFGHYNVLARVDYQNEFAAKRITEEIDNGRIYEISKVIDRVLESPEIRQSGYNVYNALTKKRRRTIGDASLYSRQSEGNTGRVDAGGNGDSRSGNRNVSDFDKVIAMGDNDYAETVRKRIQNAENQDDVLNSIEHVGTTGKSGITYDDMMSGNITEEVRAQKENLEGAVGRAGFKVIYAPGRNVPKGTIGYVDFKNKEIYISPEHFSESLLNHELTHVIDRGYDGKYVKSLISFFKEEMSKEWNDAEQAIRDKYEKIAEENPDFTYSERAIEAETLAEMCEKFSTDKYIKNAANMKTGTIRQIAVMFRYMWSKMLYHFGDNSEARKMKIASMKWQMALYRAVNEGEANVSGNDMLFASKNKKKKWVPDLSRKKLNLLMRMIDNDIKTSVNSITNTANWLFTNIDGTRVFAIYSTENAESPTLLYESKDARAIYEKEILLDLLEEYENGKSVDGESGNVDSLFIGKWLRQRSDILNSAGTLGRGSSNRNAGVLQRQSRRRPSDAFENVVKNLFEIQAGVGYSDEGASDINFSIIDDSKLIEKNSGSERKDASALEEEIGIIDEALEDKSLSRDDRLALIKDRVRLKRELSEVAGEKKEDKPSRREKVLEEYRETEDVGVLPDRNEIRAAESYDKKKISEYRKEFAEIQEALRNQEDLSADDVEELKMRRDAVVTALNRLSESNSVLSKIEGILDELGVVEEPDHRWVSDIAEELSDKQNIIKYGTYNQNDIERNFRHFFGKHFKKAYDKVIQPLYDSKKRYVEGVNEYAEKLKSDVVDNLSIRKGSRESAAVMWLGEGKRPLSKKELINIHGKEKANRLIAEAKAEGQSEVFTDYTFEDCKKDFGEETARNIQKATEVFREMYDELIADVNKTRAELYPNNPDKLVKKRKDYFHHFQEMSKGFEGLRNILNTNIGIDPMLVGTSEHTKPKSKWQAYMQERVGNRTVYDAVEGFIRYLPAAQYSIHIDPNIVNVRGLARELALAKASEYSEHGNPDANGFIAYLQKYANSLAGKTVSHFDRAVNDSNFGRTATAVIGWLNNKTKASAVLGNINSVLSQVTNMKNVIGKIENQADFIKGAIDALGGLNPDGKISARYKESGFLGERYLDKSFSQFDTKWQKMNPVKWAADVLGFADEIGTRITWNAGYNEAVRKNIANPVQYADNFTRACVAGRGIGEEALVFKSQLGKMFLPFRTEVLNDLRVQQDILFGKEYDIWEKNTDNSADNEKNYVDLSFDNELISRVEGMQGAEKYKVIRDFILEKLGDKDIVFSDGLVAKVDRSDALHIANKSANNKTTYISKLDELIQKSKLCAVDNNIEHNKFDEFRYYSVSVKLGNETYPVYLNVGRAKNGDGYHLYDITKKIGKSQSTALERVDSDLRSEIDFPINHSISQTDEKNKNNLSSKGDMLDEIIAMGNEADGKKIKTGVGKRMKNIMQLYIASMVINAALAALKSDEFDPIEEAEEGFEDGGIFGALESVLRDYADGTGDPVAFDPIYDIVTGIYQGVNEGEGAGGKVEKVMQRTVQNIAGDYVSNNPFSSAAMGIVGIDSDTSDMLFNGKVYSPGGMGMPLASNVSTVFRELSQGDEGSAVAAAVKPFLPLGTQIDRSVKGMYDYHKGYATNEAVYERMAGEDGDLKYLIEKTPGNFAKSLLFGPGAFSGESDAFYNDETRQFTEKEQAEILSKSDYDSRKVTFDEILAGRVYDNEEEDRKTLVAEEFFRGDEDSILYEIYSSGEDAALPYRNMGVSASFTDDKTDKKYKLKLSAKEAEKITDEMCTVIAKRFDRANESDVFSTMTREEQVKYLDGVKNAEYEFAKISALHDKGKMSDEDFFRFESNYKKCEAERDRALYVDDVSLYVEYNVADTVGQYASYTDVPISEEGYEQLRAWSEYASTREPDDVDKELMRLSNATDSSINVSGNPYGIINYTKNKVEYKISMPDNKIYALCDEVDKAVRSGLSKLFATTAYLNATAEVQKDMVASVKRKVRDKIRDSYKTRFKSIKIDDFYKIVNMK